MSDFTDIDITADLGGPNDAAFGDAVPQNQSAADTQSITPDGAVPAQGAPAKPSTAQAPADPTAAAPSLRDQLSTAFKGEDGKPTAQPDAQSVQAPPAAPPALTKDGEGKYRLMDGTFASQEQITAFEAAQGVQTPAGPAEYSNLLGKLTPAEQQQFSSLPAELQQFVGRTMEDVNNRAARFNEYEMLETNLIGPRREAWAQQGMTPGQAVNQLFALSDFASKSPADFVLWFSEQNRLDLDALLDERDAAAAGNPVDPAFQQLQGTVQQLQGTVQQFTQQQQQQEQQQRIALVQAFGQEKDEAGQLKRPYLTEVTDDWAAQISAIRTLNPNLPHTEVLQKAYDAACWGNPAVRAKMQKASDDARRQQEAARVQTAKAAGSSVTGGPAGSVSGAPDNANRTLRDELNAQFAAHTV